MSAPGGYERKKIWRMKRKKIMYRKFNNWLNSNLRRRNESVACKYRNGVLMAAGVIDWLA